MRWNGLLAAALIAAALPAWGQGVPTIDVTSIARLQEMISEAKLQLKEQIAQNVKLGVVYGRGRNLTLRLWPTIFSGEIDVLPS